MLGLLSPPGGEELLVSLSLDRVTFVKLGNLLLESLVLVTPFPGSCELLWGSGDLAFESLLGSSLTGRGEGSKEIRRSLLRGTVESHIGKELLGVGGSAKVNLFTFVEYTDFIENVVSRLRGLVDGNDRCGSHVFSSHL